MKSGIKQETGQHRGPSPLEKNVIDSFGIDHTQTSDLKDSTMNSTLKLLH